MIFLECEFLMIGKPMIDLYVTNVKLGLSINVIFLFKLSDTRLITFDLHARMKLPFRAQTGPTFGLSWVIDV